MCRANLTPSALMTRSARILGIAVAACLLAATPAFAGKSRLTIRGAGFGHGVGMSQYGAYGFAENGATYDAILRHYYTDTALGTTDPAQTVRVLLQSTWSVRFSGASRAGSRQISPGRTYQARRRGSTQVDLLSARGRRIATFAAPLQVVRPGGAVRLGRSGSYRGVLELRPGMFGGMNAINAVSLDDYVRGVISRESPASWPLEALKAQAVAARTYAIATSKGGAGFDHYADTRSQVYGGVAAETASTDEAVAATRGQVVTYDGEPVVTYFFSTSGGFTEDVENTSLGTEPLPWLKGVEDPYDGVSPKHRWGPIRMSLTSARAKLAGLVKGRFKGIRVIGRGSSPRIVEADIIGSRGRTRVDGATLRARLGLLDTWAYFTSIATRKSKPDATGGAQPAAAGPHPSATVSGTVVPARRGAEVQIQMRQAGAWKTVASTTVRSGGAYRAGVAQPGTYRAVFSGDAGPGIRVG
jgi:stage II sporulation protein D